MRFAALSYVRRCLSTNITEKPKICIVGSGPAGFYTAQHMSNRLKNAQIDIYERLPVPFGLVRFGVAPDHSDLKKCINTFVKIAESPNIRFVGNVELGRDVSVKDLRRAYHIVVLTYGVDDSKKMEIAGSNVKNVIQAKNFVGWYNGVPWDAEFPVDLSGCRTTVVGHGNVAIDIARILLKPVDQLRSTDITEHALAALSQSRIKEVHLVGRRGPLQVSFTIKELRELLNLENCCTLWREDMRGIADIIPQLVRPRKRLTELLVEKYNHRIPPKPKDKTLELVFCRSPKEFLGKDKVNAIKLTVNELIGEDLLEKRAVETDQEEILASDLVISSLGYKSVQVDSEIPFNFDRSVVANKQGRIEEGFYVAGWLQSGPTGVLLNTMQNAYTVAGNILKDSEGILNKSKPGFEGVKSILDKKNVQVVSWKDWLKIDKYEKEKGEKVNKPREKVVDIKEMLRIASS